MSERDTRNEEAEALGDFWSISNANLCIRIAFAQRVTSAVGIWYDTKYDEETTVEHEMEIPRLLFGCFFLC